MTILDPESPEILEKKIHQIVAMAGDGKLKDSSLCSEELRKFLRNLDAQKLFEYVHYCLEEKFDDSGFVLQDLVNELGRRLEYEVENGLYRGTKNDTGQDGIWEAAGQTIIVEVKTTAAYQIKLDTIIQYKKELAEKEKAGADASILIVVGRDNTEDLEAQIRGSRYAWDIRIISAKALCNLVDLKVKSEEQETTEKIRNILRPIEYTRLDELIDIVFTAVQDVDSDEEMTDQIPDEHGPDTSEPAGEGKHQTQEHTQPEIMDEVRKRAVQALAKREEIVSLVAIKRTQFTNDDGTIRAVSLISKVHNRGQKGLWFTFHSQQLEFLKKAEKQGFLLLTGVGQNHSHAIDIPTLRAIVPKLTAKKTETESNRRGWHINIVVKRNSKFELHIPGEDNLSLKPYEIGLE